MSAGKTHLKASLFLAAGFSVASLVSGDAQLIKCVAGSLAGVFIGCDLDVDNGNISNKIIKKRVGWIGERAWRFFWSGYSRSFKHGQFASHFPVFSTLVRMLYVYFWIILLPHVLIYFLFNTHWDLRYVLEWYGKLFLDLYFVYGLMTSDLIHYVLDKLTKNVE